MQNLNTDISEYIEKDNKFSVLDNDSNNNILSQNETEQDIEQSINFEKQVSISKFLDLDVKKLIPDKKDKKWDIQYLIDEIKIQNKQKFNEKVVIDAQVKSELNKQQKIQKQKYSGENFSANLVEELNLFKPIKLEERNKSIMKYKPEKDTDILIKSYIQKIFPKQNGETQNIPIFNDFDVKHTSMKNISFGGKNFFYIVGNEIISKDNNSSGRIVLMVYEYSLSQGEGHKNQETEKIFTIELNKSYNSVYIRDSQFIINKDQFIYYIQINENLDNRTVTMSLCSFDLIKRKTDVKLTNMTKFGKTNIVCGVFGVIKVSEEQQSEDDFLKKQYIAIISNTMGQMSYSIRNCSDINTDMVEVQPLSTGAHQIQLFKLTKEEHGSEEEDRDLLAFQAQTLKQYENEVHKKVWIIESSSRNNKDKKDEKIVSDVQEEHQKVLDNIPNITSFFNLSFVRPYCIYSLKISHKLGVKILTEHKVKDPNQYKFFMDLLQIVDLNSEQKKNVESINMVYDEFAGIYVLQVITLSHIIILYSSDESQNIRNFTEFDRKNIHPYTLTAFVLKCAKQFSKEYNNLFITRLDDGASPPILKDEFMITYFDMNGNHYSDNILALPKDLEEIDKFVAQMIKEAARKKKKNNFVKIKQTQLQIISLEDEDKTKGDFQFVDFGKFIEYKLRAFYDGQEFSANRIDLHWQDRTWTPVIVCSQENGISIQLMAKKTNKCLKELKIQTQCSFSTFKAQNICESSQIWKTGEQFHQNLQMCIVDDCLYVMEIYEFKVTWKSATIDPNIEKSMKQKLQTLGKNLKKKVKQIIDPEYIEDTQHYVDIIHIGTKLVFFNQPFPVSGAPFYPIYNQNEQIIGTQILNDKFNIQFMHFKSNDFQFRTEFSNAGYKKYYDEKEHDREVILCEVQLPEILQTDSFSNYERFTIIQSQMRILINTVPLNIIDVYSTEVEYDFFQPLEIINGQSLCDLYINFAQHIGDIIKSDWKSVTFVPGLIQDFIWSFQDNNNSNQIKIYLQKNNYWRAQMELSMDFFFSNCINRCFTYEPKMHQSAKQLYQHIMKCEKNYINQFFVMSTIFGHFLLDSDPQNKYDEFSEFFVDFKEGQSPSDLHNELRFANHQQDKKLPKFSDVQRQINNFNSETLPLKFDLITEAKKNIINQSNKIENIKKIIPVEHFIFDFTGYILQLKFKKLRKGITPDICEFTELELASLINRIMVKYSRNVEYFVSLSNLIDTMFVLSKKIEVFFLTSWGSLFAAPFILQFAIFNGQAPAIRLCLFVSLLASCFFFQLEYFQIKDQGAKNYFKSWKNWNDFLSFFLYTVFFLFRFVNTESLFPDDYKNAQINGFGIETLTFMILLNMVIFIQTVIKALYFAKVNDKFGLLTELIVEVINDISTFALFMGFWITVFAFCYLLLGGNFDNSDYNYIGKKYFFFIQTYRNSIGDINSIEYPFWMQTFEQGYKKLPNCMIFIIWVFWFLNQFMVLIILLNFLIAIISQSYDNVMSKSFINKYKNRSVINREHRLTLKSLGLGKKLDIVTMSANCLKNEDAEQWDGFVKTIQKYVLNQNLDIKHQFKQNINEMRIEMKQEMKSVKREIKTVRIEIKHQMEDQMREFKKLIQPMIGMAQQSTNRKTKTY